MARFLREPHMLDNLRVRYTRDAVYTYTAHILIACNPFKKLPIYAEERMASYQGKVRHASPPPYGTRRSRRGAAAAATATPSPPPASRADRALHSRSCPPALMAPRAHGPPCSWPPALVGGSRSV
jgi:hypothetical protein